MIGVAAAGPIESLLRQSGAAAGIGIALYLACIFLARALYRSHGPGTGRPMAWLIIAYCILAIAVIEALGLPAKGVEAARMFSIAQGWYNKRGEFQIEFIVAFSCLCALALYFIPPCLHRYSGLTGVVRALGMLSAFIIIRDASLHDLDRLFRLLIAGQIRLHMLIEGFILCCIIQQLLRAYRMHVPENHPLLHKHRETPEP